MSWVDSYVQTKARQENERGPDGSLRKWKSSEKRTSAIIFHHVEVGPKLFWSHQFPRKVSFKDKETGEQVTNFWGRPHICLEDENYLLQQYRWKDGQPKVRPQSCPMCKMTVWLREQVESGNLDWLEPIFEFENLTLVAAGIFGYLNKKLEASEIAEMRAKKLTQKEAWKQSAVAKAQWLFTVVDNDAVDDGLQVVQESNLLGEKMQEVLKDTQESLGVEDGDYCAHPYAIEWVNDPGAASFSDRYKARRIERIKLTPEVEELIRGEVPKERIEKALEKPNMSLLRDFMEEYCVLKNMPFDEFFDEGGSKKPAAKQEPEREVKKTNVKELKEVKENAAKVRASKKEEPKAEPESGVLPCDKCNAPMKATATECARCGTKYELTGADEETDF